MATNTLITLIIAGLYLAGMWVSSLAAVPPFKTATRIISSVVAATYISLGLFLSWWAALLIVAGFFTILFIWAFYK